MNVLIRVLSYAATFYDPMQLNNLMCWATGGAVNACSDRWNLQPKALCYKTGDLLLWFPLQDTVTKAVSKNCEILSQDRTIARSQDRKILSQDIVTKAVSKNTKYYDQSFDGPGGLLCVTSPLCNERRQLFVGSGSFAYNYGVQNTSIFARTLQQEANSARYSCFF